MPSDEMSGLEPVVFLAKGARVMLTMNLWSSVGLCNGATGTVVDISFQNNQNPPGLPIAVIVMLNNYRGPHVSEEQPMCVPICPITVSSQMGQKLKAFSLCHGGVVAEYRKRVFSYNENTRFCILIISKR